ncbi:fluoride efflux transporter FluC [Corynebacterium kroppenstedtii]|uniref:Fluoride-specific ion channel FluC n=1 Tax=Corynebacterium kroppenstedtii (strain DSM 44385 / JCM 11950 / CIP 105744 / CCUG 35717) TaxID=645127 RepID=C4LGF6_CORK4|nr:CrcB family protein [Corynebacterium kroppenstedtii]ACR18775.1 putative membrane protein [Corynebacterium kroppenstedtii DSM 44385]
MSRVRRPVVPKRFAGSAALVFVGGAVGTLVRDVSTSSPVVPTMWWVFAVNVVGSAVLGFLGARFARLGRVNAKLLLGTGFCGGLTTYSTLAVDVARWFPGVGAGGVQGTGSLMGMSFAVYYALFSVICGAIAAFAGAWWERVGRSEVAQR